MFRSNGPVPAKLITFREIRHQDIETKIRFLCCVESYRSSDGVLLATDASTAEGGRRVEVDVNLVLDTCDSTKLFRKGMHINVIGYLASNEAKMGLLANAEEKASLKRRRSVKEAPVRVRAILAWGTGPDGTTVSKFDRAVRARQEAMQRLSSVRDADDELRSSARRSVVTDVQDRHEAKIHRQY